MVVRLAGFLVSVVDGIIVGVFVGSIVGFLSIIFAVCGRIVNVTLIIMGGRNVGESVGLLVGGARIIYFRKSSLAANFLSAFVSASALLLSLFAWVFSVCV